MSEEPIVLKGVHFAYNSVPVLEDVTITVSANSLAYVVGPNGGGKTTLLKLILGLLRPQRGSIRVFGTPPLRSARRMGYVPQQLQFDPRFPITVKEIVLMGRLNNRGIGFYSRADKQAAHRALDELGVGELAGRQFADLSGGQRQRVLIARALAGSPDLLLLDEPTASIDIEAEEKLFDIVRELNKRMTILMVSHDLGFVSGLVKGVICVNRKVQVHPTSEITHGTIRQMFDSDVRMIRHDISCAEQDIRDD